MPLTKEHRLSHGSYVKRYENHNKKLILRVYCKLVHTLRRVDIQNYRRADLLLKTVKIYLVTREMERDVRFD